jgi:hypothetical protein
MKYFKNVCLYLLIASPIFILAPFFFGFPESDGLHYFVMENDKHFVSELYFVSSLISYVICIIGILLFVTNLIKLQKQYGVKPRIIFVLIDQSFVSELYRAIKHNVYAKIILLADLLFIIVLLLR